MRAEKMMPDGVKWIVLSESRAGRRLLPEILFSSLVMAIDDAAHIIEFKVFNGHENSGSLWDLADTRNELPWCNAAGNRTCGVDTSLSLSLHGGGL